MALSADERARYDRNIRIPGLGVDGQQRLRAARVLVVGAGGLGSPVIAYLAAAGVGTLTIADGDAVELSNLQRQVIHRTEDVGQNKAESARRFVAALNPAVRVHTHGWVTKEDAEALAARHDVVLECSDTFATKFLLADACDAARVPLVWGTIVGHTLQVTVFHPGTDGRPAVRLRDVYPAPPAPGTTPTAHDVGVLGGAVGHAGGVMATEAVKLLTGVGEPLVGRLLVADLAAGRWDVVRIGGSA